MGTLVAKKYPSKLVLGLADHTYVECGNGGKGWGCWGGKTGGKLLTQGTGSTARADVIAGPKERAAVSYLIEGVCHQAANRVLYPATLLVTGARGYSLSFSIYGTYGTGSFNQHPGVTGDVGACIAPAAMAPASATAAPTAEEKKHAMALKGLYNRSTARIATPLDKLNARLREFMFEVNHVFAGKLSRKAASGLEHAKSRADLEHRRLCENFLRQELGAVDFIRAFNVMTDAFQDEAADAMGSASYRRFFGARPGEHFYLPDPVVIDELYGSGTAAAVYGPRLRG
jgi:hypothetical protein